MTWSAAAVRNVNFFFACRRRGGGSKVLIFFPVGGAAVVFIDYRQRPWLESFNFFFLCWRRGGSKVYKRKILSKIKKNMCLFRYLNANLFKKL
jgi:hypothetical protein